MGAVDQTLTPDYALYHGDCMSVMQSWPSDSVHLSVYSPPFGGLYQYSSDERDLSNCLNREEFFQHYEFVVREIHRLLLPGRVVCVHCAEIPSGNTGSDSLYDLPGDIIRLHERVGFDYAARYQVWKEPLTVRNRLMIKSLAHKGIVDDSSRCSNASADVMVVFRKKGKNVIPIEHPNGLTFYAGERQPPTELIQYRGWTGSQLENRYSHWVWRQYASAFWDDVRLDRVLPHRSAKDENDEKHVHPLQLDVIERAVILWSNPGEVVLTPFMGVGSEVYGAVLNGRKGVGIELKNAYYQQALKNVKDALKSRDLEQAPLLASVEEAV
jgi:DNA modification methylase